jgi:aminopeptidase N
MKILTFCITIYVIMIPALSSAQALHDYDAMMQTLRRVKQAEMQAWQEGIAWLQQKGDLRQDEFDSRYVTIDIQPNLSSQTIQATVTTRFTSLTDGVADIILDFYDDFTIDSIGGNAVSYTLAGEVYNITLDQPYDSGETFTVRTTYHGSPPLIGGIKGFRFVSHAGIPVIATLCTPFLAHSWWPCVDGPADKLDSVHLRITIPDTSYGGYPLYAASVGKLMSITYPIPGSITYEWHENYPIVPYYVSIAMTNYRIFSHTYYYDADSMAVPYYVFPEDYGAAQGTFAETVDMIEFFAGLFGEYPFVLEKYSMAEIGFYGAIEKQTKTIMGGVSSSWYMIVLHELAHMWFGDMISPVSWHHCWVNEGFATYCEALWWGDKYGQQQYHSYMNGLKYWQGGTIYLYDISNPFGIFLTICYDKGAWVLHMLRHVVGDSVFFDAMYQYATDPQYMYKNASTEDVQQVFQTVSGMDLTAFFDQWIYDEYYPRYLYRWYTTDDTDGRTEVTVVIEQTQGNQGWRAVFEMPIDLRFTIGGSDTTITVQNNDTLQTYQFSFSQAPTAVSLDPDEWILRYAELGIEEDQEHAATTAHTQLHCTPNPVSKNAVIEYTVGAAGDVCIELYNVAGQKIRTLVQERNDTGVYRFTFDASTLAQGIYFLCLNRSTTTKMVLMGSNSRP